MKKRKSFMAGILSLLLAVCTLFGSLPVYAAEQVYTDAPEKAGTIVKVKNDGTEDSSFSESIMNADGETAYCIQLGYTESQIIPNTSKKASNSGIS